MIPYRRYRHRQWTACPCVIRRSFTLWNQMKEQTFTQEEPKIKDKALTLLFIFIIVVRVLDRISMNWLSLLILELMIIYWERKKIKTLDKSEETQAKSRRGDEIRVCGKWFVYLLRRKCRSLPLCFREITSATAQKPTLKDEETSAILGFAKSGAGEQKALPVWLFRERKPQSEWALYAIFKLVFILRPFFFLFLI